MGKKSQIRREQKSEAEKERKEEIRTIVREKNPWANFWKRIDFWVYIVCISLIISYPFIRPDQVNPEDQVEIHTSMGDIEITFYQDATPKTVKNFQDLIKKSYYDKVIFHRVIKGFMVQSGDPTGTGTGGESASGQPFEDEISATALGLDKEIVSQTPNVFNQLSADEKTQYGSDTVEQYYETKGYVYDNKLKSHHMTVGSVAMANAGPNTNSSQFFIISEKDQLYLDGQHTVFAHVTKGLDVVKAISEVTVDDKDKPADPVYIISMELK